MNAPTTLELRFASEDTLTAALSERIVGQLRAALAAGREASLVVPGGRTPVPLFRRLRTSALDWRRVWITLADERWVDAQAEASNEALARRELLKDAAAQAHFVGLKNHAATAAAGAARSAAALAAVPRPFDAVLLGMGEDGHFASLFPHSPGLRAALDPDAEPGCVPMQAPSPPQERITLNLSALLDARLLLLPLPGAAKASTLRAAQAPGPETELPVRALLRQHRVPLEIYRNP